MEWGRQQDNLLDLAPGEEGPALEFCWGLHIKYCFDLGGPVECSGSHITVNHQDFCPPVPLMGTQAAGNRALIKEVREKGEGEALGLLWAPRGAPR